MGRDEEAAAAIASKMLIGDEAPEEEAPQVSSDEETVVAEEPQETETEFSFDLFDGEEPEGLDDEELDAPTLEEVQEEIELEEDEFEEFDELPDPKILARLKKAEKEAQFYKELRIKAAAKDWRAEAEKFYPLSTPFLDSIKAESRRSFLKQARQYHSAMRPYVEEKVLKPAKEAVERARQEAIEEARKEAEKRWGPPTVEAPEVSSDVDATREAVEKARQRGELSDVILAMMRGSDGA